MTRIFITGSADGLGLLCAQQLVAGGHTVVLHGRNAARSATALAACPGALTALSGDLSSLTETKALAAAANALGPFDAVIHNAGVGPREPARGNSADGLPRVWAVNALAPYVLTALMARPKRLVYVSSSLHAQGSAGMQDVEWRERKWDGFQAYADSKLQLVMLSNAVARRWKGQVWANSMDPGWVATKMGGSGATGSLELGPKTQVWLALGEGDAEGLTGKYWFHQKERQPVKEALDEGLQEAFLKKCEEVSGVKMPQ